MTDRTDEQLLELIKDKCYQEGDKSRFNCDDAIKMADELGIDPMVIAGICNRHDIRIAACRLGCFK